MTRSCFSLDMDTFNQTKEAIRNDPKLGQGNFVAVTEWTDGSHGPDDGPVVHHRDRRARTAGRDRQGDRPDGTPPRGGGDLPADRLGDPCQQAGRGVPVAANRDERRLRPVRLLAIDPKIPPGFLNITYSVEVDTDAEPAILEEIRAAAENGSPVTQNVLKGTPIQSEIKKV